MHVWPDASDLDLKRARIVFDLLRLSESYERACEVLSAPRDLNVSERSSLERAAQVPAELQMVFSVFGNVFLDDFEATWARLLKGRGRSRKARPAAEPGVPAFLRELLAYANAMEQTALGQVDAATFIRGFIEPYDRCLAETGKEPAWALPYIRVNTEDYLRKDVLTAIEKHLKKGRKPRNSAKGPGLETIRKQIELYRLAAKGLSSGEVLKQRRDLFPSTYSKDPHAFAGALSAASQGKGPAKLVATAKKTVSEMIRQLESGVLPPRLSPRA